MGPPAKVVFRNLFDFAAKGAEQIPTSGPAIIAANHFSHLDPALITDVARRNIRYIAVDELYGKSAVLDQALRFFVAIPTTRTGVPLGAMKDAVAHVEAGGLLGIFPEGRRVSEWGENPPKRGAAWMAWMTGVPLLPVAIHGTAGTMSVDDMRLRRTSVRMWVGEPMHWFDYADRVDPLGTMMKEWHAWVDAKLAPWQVLG